MASDIELVVLMSQRLEALLAERYGARGSGLYEKTTSVTPTMPNALMEDLLWVARERNRVVHEAGARLQSQTAFASTCERLERELSELPSSTADRVSRAGSRTSHVSVPRRKPALGRLLMVFAAAALGGIALLWLDGRQGQRRLMRPDERGPAVVRPAPLMLDLGNQTIMEFVYVPAGTLHPSPHSDNIDGLYSVRPFYLGRYEVTEAQWIAIMGRTNAHRRRSSKPVTNISWEECGAFCRALSLLVRREARVPTDVEWEYACRAGSVTQYSFSERKSSLWEHAWYRSNSADEKHPVGQKQPNAWGLYDMHGNVWEWCQDVQNRAPRAWSHGSSVFELYMTCGGSFVDAERELRNSSQRWWDRGGNDYVGFRVAVSPEGP